MYDGRTFREATKTTKTRCLQNLRVEVDKNRATSVVKYSPARRIKPDPLGAHVSNNQPKT